MEFPRAGKLDYLLITFIFTVAMFEIEVLRTPPVPPVICPQLVVQDSTKLPGLFAGLVDDVRVFALQNKTSEYLAQHSDQINSQSTSTREANNCNPIR